MGPQEVLQCLAVFAAAVRAADAVDVQLEVRNAQTGEEVPGEADDLGIRHHVLAAEDLDAELMELALSALLHLLVAEARDDVEVLTGLRFCVQFVLDIGTDDACGALGL